MTAKAGTSCPSGLIRATALMAALEIEHREPHLFVTAHLDSTALVLLHISMCVCPHMLYISIHESSYREPHRFVTGHLASTAPVLLVLVYIPVCPRTAVYLYMCVLILLHTCRRREITLPNQREYCCISPYMCPHIGLYLYMCPHTAL
jgi:hypothetical protein